MKNIKNWSKFYKDVSDFHSCKWIDEKKLCEDLEYQADINGYTGYFFHEEVNIKGKVKLFSFNRKFNESTNNYEYEYIGG